MCADTATYCYRWPHPAVTVDVVVLAETGAQRQVALIRRAAPPFTGRWALPGGFIGIDEHLEAAAHRELREETGLEGLALRQLGAFGRPGRDPRERVISVAYAGRLDAGPVALRAGDDAAEAAWFDVTRLPPLAFDHGEIIAAAMNKRGPS